tara:strand:- start:381 stop:671 length:291 start_codon:yes stop_codon:yes gene_type:complete
MANLNISARLEAISEIANRDNVDFKLRDDEIIEWSVGDKPTEEEIQSKINSVAYARNRLTEYPSIQELVVALYDESDKQALIDKRNAVKAKYPKPE